MLALGTAGYVDGSKTFSLILWKIKNNLLFLPWKYDKSTIHYLYSIALLTMLNKKSININPFLKFFDFELFSRCEFNS